MKNWVPPDLGYSLQISAVSLQISAEFLSCFLKKQTKKKNWREPTALRILPAHPSQAGWGEACLAQMVSSEQASRHPGEI